MLTNLHSTLNRNKRKRDSDGATGDDFTPSSNPLNNNSRKNKKRKTTELKNFYAFQIKEEKMKQLEILRHKFDENKQKIQRMKEMRKFNPF
jgi:ribosomal RNA-processing protein 7